MATQQEFGFPRQAAVLGAGIMGVQIAALLANAGVPTLLFDLPDPNGNNLNAGAERALARLTELDPPPLALAELSALIEPLNYGQHLHRLRDCELVIEAISERLDAKQGFYVRVIPYIDPQAVFATTTAGLSINRLARVLPENRRANFCGTQFFNPPRYRPLIELVANDASDPQRLACLENFLHRGLGKQVVRANDTPNFIANRIGLLALAVAVHHAERLRLAPDLVDRLVRDAFDLEQQAVYDRLHAIGARAFGDALANARRELPHDPWLALLGRPARQTTQKIAAGDDIDAGVATALRHEFNERWLLLRASRHPQARYLWAVLRDVLHYSAVWLETIATSARQVDLAVRWGFGWKRGPFELWQQLGWRQLREWLEQDRQAGRTLTDVALPDWVWSINRVYGSKGAYAPVLGKYSPLAVIRQQQTLFSKTMFSGSTLRLWDIGDDLAALSPTDPKADPDTLLKEFISALNLAEDGCRALLLWQPAPGFFSHRGFTAPDAAALERQLYDRQQTCKTLRLCPIPVVAAMHGPVDGFGLALALHCSRVVTGLETRYSFCHPGESAMAAGCGYSEFARRAACAAAGYPLLPLLLPSFDWLISRRPAANALEARKYNLLNGADCIIMQAERRLEVAKSEALALASAGYRPPPPAFAVAGRDGYAVLTSGLSGNAEQCRLGRLVAEILCGGSDTPSHSVVRLDQQLALERAVLLDFAAYSNRHTAEQQNGRRRL